MQIIFDKKPVTWLINNIAAANIATQFSESELAYIGQDVVDMTKIDQASRIEWLDVVERGLKIAKQVTETKSFPWDGAANTKDPLIAVAAMQFSARAAAEVIRGRDVVKSQTTGEDPDGKKERRAKRISQYMSYQCLEEMTEWQSDTDQLLMSISPIGMYYKKTTYDDVLERPLSVAVSPEKVTVNEAVKDLASSERITQEISFTRNEVIERMRSDIWCDIEKHLSDDDNGKLHDFLESHCWYDLDGDGYREPYIVTVHQESGQVVRICARYDESGIVLNSRKEVKRINPVQYFTEFPFLPAFDAKFHKTGFCQLLTPLVEQINTLQNQLIDAGTLSNVGGGFIGKGAKLPAGGLRFRLNQWIPVETTGASLRDNLFPNPAKEPSAVLFNLLAQLNDKAQRLASINDTMMGDIPGGNVPASTVLASLDQALKVYTGILRRLFRSFQAEFTKLYRINNLYLTDEKYITVLDLTPQQVQEDFGIDPQLITKESNLLIKKDFDLNDCDVQPVMDPTAASEAIRLARANALMQTSPGNPEVLRDYYKAIGIAESRIDAYLPQQDASQNPALVKLQADILASKEKGEAERDKILNEAHKIALEEDILPFKKMVLEAQSLKLRADAEGSLAKSEAIQVATHISAFREELAQMQQNFDSKIAILTEQQEREMDEYDLEPDHAPNGGTDGSAGGTEDGADGIGGVGEAGEYGQGDSMVTGQGSIPDGNNAAGGLLLRGESEQNGVPNGGILGDASGTRPAATVADVNRAESEPGSMM